MAERAHAERYVAYTPATHPPYRLGTLTHQTVPASLHAPSYRAASEPGRDL